MPGRLPKPSPKLQAPEVKKAVAKAVQKCEQPMAKVKKEQSLKSIQEMVKEVKKTIPDIEKLAKNTSNKNDKAELAKTSKEFKALLSFWQKKEQEAKKIFG